MNITGKNFRANNGLRITIGPEQPSDDTPSVSPSGCQLPQRGSRETFPFIGVLAKIRGWRAIFIAPTEALNV